MSLTLYPAIDIRGGSAVRLMQGDYDRETAYDADPLEAAKRWVEGGADWLHIVDLDPLTEDDDEEVKTLIAEHAQRTGSLMARNVLASWAQRRERFVKVMPRDYKRALEEAREAQGAAA